VLSAFGKYSISLFATMRVRGTLPQPGDIGPSDVFFIPNGFCDLNDDRWFERVKGACAEWTGRHGNSHLASTFRDADLECLPPDLKEATGFLETSFGIKTNACQVNWYRNGAHWKPFHRDHPGQMTISVILGAARPLQLRHSESGYIHEFLLGHGDIFAFTPKINSMFEHGLPEAATESERISLIVWGTVMNTIENTPKRKRQHENRDLMETPPRRQCPPSSSRPVNDMTSHRPCPPLTGEVAVGDRVQLTAMKDIR
jgi:hypothetical protein